MINAAGPEPRDEVPEADWVEQQTEAEADREAPTVPLRHASTTEADTADLADQDAEVVLDEEA
jgi:hypothetical protein